jgi:hypothetical protein
MDRVIDTPEHCLPEMQPPTPRGSAGPGGAPTQAQDARARETSVAAATTALERLPDERAGGGQSDRNRQRRPVQERNRTYRISSAERELMTDIGSFRTVAIEDLIKFKYQGDSAKLSQDIRSLREQNLLQRRNGFVGKDHRKLAVLVLTKEGKHLLEREQPVSSQQALYDGFVKPGEVAHDAAIYRMYQAEAGLIEGPGGRVHRIILDYELKRQLYAVLAKATDLEPLAYAKLQAEVAQENDLKVVEGKIPLPDLRLEYETPEGELTKVDLELATEHYHGRQISEKARAGFKMYTADASVLRRSAVLEEREITAAILSL